jgi:hypothetical protein
MINPIYSNELGVTKNGIPYLTIKGLSLMIGVEIDLLQSIILDSDKSNQTSITKSVREILVQYDYNNDLLYSIEIHNGVETITITEVVCMAMLEYFAFVSSQPLEQAKNSFRILTKKKFKDLVSSAVLYEWVNSMQKLDLTLDNEGYFNVIKEIARATLSFNVLNEIQFQVIEDSWYDYWKINNLSAIYGEQIINIDITGKDTTEYPIEALGVFRGWFAKEKKKLIQLQ